MRTFTWRTLFILLAGLILAGCQPNGRYTGTVILEGVHRVDDQERLPGVVLLVDGSLVIGEGGQVEGPVYMLGGRLDANGLLLSDLSILGGQAVLGPQAVIGGDLNLGGGTLERSPQAVIAGQFSQGENLQIPARPTVFEALRNQWLSILGQAGLFALLTYLLVRYLPRPVTRLSRAVSRHALVSTALGLLVGVVSLSLLVLMAFTIILIPVSLLLGLVLIAAVAVGWAGLGQALGAQLAQRLGWQMRPAWGAALGSLIFMAAFGGLSLFQGAGWIQLTVAAAGLGAAYLTRFGLSEFTPVEDIDSGDF
jgi:hypothetical protein